MGELLKWSLHISTAQTYSPLLPSLLPSPPSQVRTFSFISSQALSLAERTTRTSSSDSVFRQKKGREGGREGICELLCTFLSSLLSQENQAFFVCELNLAGKQASERLWCMSCFPDHIMRFHIIKYM